MVPKDATHRGAGHGMMTCHVAHDAAHRRALEAPVGMGAEGKHPSAMTIGKNSLRMLNLRD